MAAPATQQLQCLQLADDDIEEEIEEIIDYGDEDGEGLGDFEEDGEDLNLVDTGAGQSAEDNKFDAIVGALEDMLVSPEFEEVQSNFAQANCDVFDEGGENKLVYTEIFERYSNLLEEAITAHLSTAVEGFDLMEFIGMLNARKEALDGEVFDMPHTDGLRELQGADALVQAAGGEQLRGARPHP